MRHLVTAAFVVLAACSCSNRKQFSIEKSGIAIDSVCIDSTVALTAEEHSPTGNVSLRVIYVKGKNDGKINREIVNFGLLVSDYLIANPKQIDVPTAVRSFATQYLADYKKEYGDMFRNDRQNPTSYNCSYVLHTAVGMPAENVLAYTSKLSVYGGGEHGVNQTIVRNIDLRTGRVIKLKDVFVPGYEASLKDVVMEHLLKRFKGSDLDALKKQHIFANEYVYVPENFILADDAITFIYCEDEIAPHDMGEIRIKVDKSEIKKLLR